VELVGTEPNICGMRYETFKRDLETYHPDGEGEGAIQLFYYRKTYALICN
jgi:hypothetical protein